MVSFQTNLKGFGRANWRGYGGSGDTWEAGMCEDSPLRQNHVAVFYTETMPARSDSPTSLLVCLSEGYPKDIPKGKAGQGRERRSSSIQPGIPKIVHALLQWFSTFKRMHISLYIYICMVVYICICVSVCLRVCVCMYVRRWALCICLDNSMQMPQSTWKLRSTYLVFVVSLGEIAYNIQIDREREREREREKEKERRNDSSGRIPMMFPDRIPKPLGVASDSFQPSFLDPFPQGFGWFCRKKAAWKEWGRYPSKPPCHRVRHSKSAPQVLVVSFSEPRKTTKYAGGS